MRAIQALPGHVCRYSETPVFTETSVPAKLLRDHSLKAGVWGELQVVSGQLEYREAGECSGPLVVSANQCHVIPPERPHHIRPIGSAHFQIVFYR